MVGKGARGGTQIVHPAGVNSAQPCAMRVYDLTTGVGHPDLKSVHHMTILYDFVELMEKQCSVMTPPPPPPRVRRSPASHWEQSFSNETSRTGWGGLGSDLASPVLPMIAAEHDGTFHQEGVTLNPGTVHALCGNLSKNYRDVACAPDPDAFNPCEDLMGNWGLRAAVWVVAVAALVGNLAVLLVLLSSRFRMTVPKFLMCNLALADLCMGAYLILIAVMDAKSIGTYFNYAIDWQSGAGCQVAGFLTVFASELSIFTLTVITSERWYTITYAIHLNKRLKLRTAGKIMAAGWLYAVAMAALPLLGVSGYSKTSICLPMDNSDNTDIAYLVTLLSVNGLAFWIICACYGRMYCSIRGGQDAVATLARSDMTVAKRMALLVFTDFACWAPIAFFGLTALAGYPLIDVPHTKILLVFFYPLNSCANPYLYALLTQQYRRDLFILLSRYGLCSDRAALYKGPPGVAPRGCRGAVTGEGGRVGGGLGAGCGGGPGHRGSLLTTLTSIDGNPTTGTRPGSLTAVPELGMHFDVHRRSTVEMLPLGDAFAEKQPPLTDKEQDKGSTFLSFKIPSNKVKFLRFSLQEESLFTPPEDKNPIRSQFGKSTWAPLSSSPPNHTASYYPFGLYALSNNYANGLGIGDVELEEVNPPLRGGRVKNHLQFTRPRFEPRSPRPRQLSSTRLARQPTTPPRREVSPHLREGIVENYSGNATLSITDRDSDSNLLIIGSPVYCKSEALDHVAAELGYTQQRQKYAALSTYVCNRLHITRRAEVPVREQQLPKSGPETSLWNQLVWDVRNNSIKRRRLSEPDLSYNKALELAISLETAMKDVEELAARSTSGKRVSDH
uniref:G-protein coupled receptors family 1 profile domain-containing protein n=1 Tax=Timema cristinae TaxID=61476 RepID=A0A7R9GRX1_TIMCR|nr:unnamed protein product [Timema cristinae]